MTSGPQGTPRVIAEIQVAPTPAGTPEDPHAFVEAAVHAIQGSGLHAEVGALGTTLEGGADEVWATLRAAHEAMLAAGATSGISHVKVASTARWTASPTSSAEPAPRSGDLIVARPPRRWAVGEDALRCGRTPGTDDGPGPA